MNKLAKLSAAFAACIIACVPTRTRASDASLRSDASDWDVLHRAFGAPARGSSVIIPAIVPGPAESGSTYSSVGRPVGTDSYTVATAMEGGTAFAVEFGRRYQAAVIAPAQYERGIVSVATLMSYAEVGPVDLGTATWQTPTVRGHTALGQIELRLGALLASARVGDTAEQLDLEQAVAACGETAGRTFGTRYEYRSRFVAIDLGYQADSWFLVASAVRSRNESGRGGGSQQQERFVPLLKYGFEHERLLLIGPARFYVQGQLRLGKRHGSGMDLPVAEEYAPDTRNGLQLGSTLPRRAVTGDTGYTATLSWSHTVESLPLSPTISAGCSNLAVRTQATRVRDEDWARSTNVFLGAFVDLAAAEGTRRSHTLIGVGVTTALDRSPSVPAKRITVLTAFTF